MDMTRHDVTDRLGDQRAELGAFDRLTKATALALSRRRVLVAGVVTWAVQLLGVEIASANACEYGCNTCCFAACGNCGVCPPGGAMCCSSGGVCQSVPCCRCGSCGACGYFSLCFKVCDDGCSETWCPAC
jgi:hypothetical protein